MPFNCPMRGIMPVINIPLIGIGNDDEHHKVIIKRQTKMTKTKILPKILCLPIGSTVVVQHEDWGLWSHGTIEGKGDHNHHDRCYHICMIKTGRLVTQNRQHIKPT